MVFSPVLLQPACKMTYGCIPSLIGLKISLLRISTDSILSIFPDNLMNKLYNFLSDLLSIVLLQWNLDVYLCSVLFDAMYVKSFKKKSVNLALCLRNSKTNHTEIE